jgi:LacI family transcriptional regulator
MAKPTINDVARLAGVSKKTVSRVINNSPLLNDATRAKVEQVIAELGYVPDPQARALALRRSVVADAEVGGNDGATGHETVARATDRKLIGLVFDQSAAPLLPAVQQGVFEALRNSEFALVVRPLDGSAAEADLRLFLERQRPSGVLLLPPLSESRALAEICRELGCHHVRMSATPAGDTAHAVVSDDRAAAAEAIAYLISLGHQRIGMVTGPEDSRTAQERELGYLDAMADHDLDRGPALIATGDNSFQSGVTAGHLLLEVSPCPTAILAGNDEMAAGILYAAAQKGIAVPDMLSVIGFEDTGIGARLHLPLTAVRVPIAAMAEAAAFKLIDRGTAERQPSKFMPELVVRGSAARAPG